MVKLYSRAMIWLQDAFTKKKKKKDYNPNSLPLLPKLPTSRSTSTWLRN